MDEKIVQKISSKIKSIDWNFKEPTKFDADSIFEDVMKKIGALNGAIGALGEITLEGPDVDALGHGEKFSIKTMKNKDKPDAQLVRRLTCTDDGRDLLFMMLIYSKTTGRDVARLQKGGALDFVELVRYIRFMSDLLCAYVNRTKPVDGELAAALLCYGLQSSIYRLDLWPVGNRKLTKAFGKAFVYFNRLADYLCGLEATEDEAVTGWPAHLDDEKLYEIGVGVFEKYDQDQEADVNRILRKLAPAGNYRVTKTFSRAGCIEEGQSYSGGEKTMSVVLDTEQRDRLLWALERALELTQGVTDTLDTLESGPEPDTEHDRPGETGPRADARARDAYRHGARQLETLCEEVVRAWGPRGSSSFMHSKLRKVKDALERAARLFKRVRGLCGLATDVCDIRWPDRW